MRFGVIKSRDFLIGSFFLICGLVLLFLLVRKPTNNLLAIPYAVIKAFDNAPSCCPSHSPPDAKEKAAARQEAARKLLEPLAEQGCAYAQFLTSRLYAELYGGKDERAVKWALEAADQGIPEAQFEVGYLYDNGWVVEEDQKEAVKWWQRAAERGLVAAQGQIGALYLEGSKGVPRDYTEAEKWLRRAAEKDSFDAKQALGKMYLNGWGVNKNNVLAFMWYGLTVSNYHGEKEDIAFDVQETSQYVPGIKPEEISEGRHLIEEWEKNHPEFSRSALSQRYFNKSWKHKENEDVPCNYSGPLLGH